MVFDYRRFRRIFYGYIFRSSSGQILRFSLMLIFLSLFFLGASIKQFYEPHIPSPQSTRLHPNEPITIKLRPFPVCHPRKLKVANITVEYYRKYPDKQRQPCFLVESIDGGEWWSYVTQEFAEILTHLREIGVESGIKYRPFPPMNNIHHGTNLTKLFLNACGMDENVSVEHQMPIVALMWEINRRTWHHFNRNFKDLFKTTRLRFVTFIDDLHFTTRGSWLSRMYLFESISSEIFSAYPYIFHNYYTNISSNKLTWLPHAASTLSYNSINESAENVLFVSGANLIEWYPCRSRTFELCYRRKDLVACLEHPGYGITMKNDSSHYYGGQRYFSYMRQYVFGLATCQSVQYAIAKLFEIPANGLALVTTNDLIGVLRSLHFNLNEHFLAIDCSSSNQLISELLRIQHTSTQTILNMREKSQHIIHERHLTRHRAALIHVRLLAQALIASTTSDMERIQWEQWGRNC
ncbi:unnamed protein product [Rotaria magnacalcarata]|uniref:Uncharacterized protein n=4 Tax=Rotaria magnacalcarata TaxID=392030 RepID=A0A816LAI2_9BILA|nr:unnamed protein product [Rotaria magnacalcarata]CAF1602106.1 unnamed protein product [Rotaria magnacalcarata]CAF1931644.1 unnamed protein product [Rotaria magnacalcarata]CAF4728802.1 unnamed protein product [Rotaria magnacalcarata]